MFWACAMWKNTNDARLCWILQIVLWSESFLLGRFNVWHVEVKRLSLMMPPKGPVPKYQPRLAAALCCASKIVAFGLCMFFVQESFQSPPGWEGYIIFFFEDGGMWSSGSWKITHFFWGESKPDANLYGKFLVGISPESWHCLFFLWEFLMTPCVKLPWISSWHQLSRSSNFPTARWHQMRWGDPQGFCFTDQCCPWNFRERCHSFPCHWQRHLYIVGFTCSTPRWRLARN